MATSGFDFRAGLAGLIIYATRPGPAHIQSERSIVAATRSRRSRCLLFNIPRFVSDLVDFFIAATGDIRAEYLIADTRCPARSQIEHLGTRVID